MAPRRHDDESTPSVLMGIAFTAVLLVVGCTDAFADLLVTDVHGSVARAGSREPVALLQRLVPGTRLTLTAGASLELYDAAAATVQPVAGPARLSVTAQGVIAESGSLGPVRKLGEAFRNVKVTGQDVSLGSLRMRSSESRVLEGPEGFVGFAQARLFTWKPLSGLARFELATSEGEPVHRARPDGNHYVLPEAVRLEPGIRYVWGVGSANEAEAPVDWTEFVIDEPGRVSPRAPVAGASEKRLLALSLRSAGLRRAAERVATRSDFP